MKYNFVEKAQSIHGNKYDYSKVKYINAKSKIIIICSIHGEFEQTPSCHIQGNGCQKCGIKKCISSISSTTNEFIKKANIIHNNRYDYSKVKYINNHTNVIVICYQHGEFSIRPGNHLFKKGCVKCAKLSTIKKLSKTNVVFIDQAKIIHNNFYDYSQTDYINAFTKIIIICPAHGIFSQQPAKHLCGQGCPKCFHHISKPETEWLDILNIPNEFRHKTLKINNKKYMVDAYDPTTNIIYEFYGDYWHGNPLKYKSNKMNTINKQSFGTLYTKTMERENKLIKAGYKLITIWEMDYIKLYK
jgi:hypothetical protein